MEHELYYSEKLNSYCIKEGEICDNCNFTILEKFGFRRGYDKLLDRNKMGSLNIYCFECFKKLSIKPTDYEELNLGSVFIDFPKDIKPIGRLHKFSVSDFKGISVFEASSNKTEETIDNTKYANRNSIEGASIGKAIDLPAEEEKAKDLTFRDGLDLLEDLKNAKPMLPGKKDPDSLDDQRDKK